MNAATGANGNTPLRFGTQYVTYEMQINPNNMKSIQFNCQPHGDVQMYMNQNDINCLSHYFERKVSSPPYRPNTAKGIEIITNFTMESTLNGIKLTKMYHKLLAFSLCVKVIWAFSRSLLGTSLSSLFLSTRHKCLSKK